MVDRFPANLFKINYYGGLATDHTRDSYIGLNLNNGGQQVINFVEESESGIRTKIDNEWIQKYPYPEYVLHIWTFEDDSVRPGNQITTVVVYDKNRRVIAKKCF